MASMRVPTVKVHHKGGDFAKRGEVMIINRSVYDDDPSAFALCVDGGEGRDISPVLPGDPVSPETVGTYSYAELDKAELRSLLDKRKTPYDGRAGVDTLRALLQETEN